MQDRIINTACELFMERGIRSVTMDEIAAHLGISKRTLYEMFANKDELLEKSIDYMRQEWHNKMEQIIKETPSCIFGLLNVLKYSTEQHNMNKTPKDIFYSDLRKCRPDLIKRHNEHRHSHILLMAKHLEKGIKQGTVRKNLNLSLASTLLMAQVEGLESVKTMREYSHVEIFTTLVLSFCRGISTEKGLKEIEDFERENNL